eukprot:XP_017453165.1 PREDICTED: uncharacterized protein LOC103693446 isoform X2 [Rattus norvegicus]
MPQNMMDSPDSGSPWSQVNSSLAYLHQRCVTGGCHTVVVHMRSFTGGLELPSQSLRAELLSHSIPRAQVTWQLTRLLQDIPPYCPWHLEDAPWHLHIPSPKFSIFFRRAQEISADERRGREGGITPRVVTTGLPTPSSPCWPPDCEVRVVLCLVLNIWNYLLQYFNIYYIDFALNAL